MNWFQKYKETTTIYYKLHAHLSTVTLTTTAIIMSVQYLSSAPTSAIMLSILLCVILSIFLTVRTQIFKSRIPIIEEHEDEIETVLSEHDDIPSMSKEELDLYVEKLNQIHSDLTDQDSRSIKSLSYGEKLQLTAYTKEKEHLEKKMTEWKNEKTN